MPSSATITAFYSFVAGTRARASEVNNNFDNLRGHLIPTNTDTGTASHQTHDLGSTDHQWRTIYLKNPPVIGAGGTPKIEIDVVTDATLPAVEFEQVGNLSAISFIAATETGICFQFVVPDDYTVGNRISLTLRGYCDTSPAHFSMELGTALFKSSSTSMLLTAPSNFLTSTSNINPTLSGILFQDTSLRLTGATGLINSLTVSAGDVLTCYLKRMGAATGDTNSGYFHLTNILVDLNN